MDEAGQLTEAWLATARPVEAAVRAPGEAMPHMDLPRD